MQRALLTHPVGFPRLKIKELTSLNFNETSGASHIIRRSQIVSQLPYAEIHDNTISSQMLQSTFYAANCLFGASKFDQG